MSDFSFDDWAKLYRTSPEQFEAKKKALIEAEIQKAPVAQRNKLRLLQMEIDATVANAKSPLGAAIAVSVMMQNKVSELKEAFESLKAPVAEIQEQLKQLE